MKEVKPMLGLFLVYSMVFVLMSFTRYPTILVLRKYGIYSKSLMKVRLL